MISYTWKRIRRAPGALFGAFLLAAILSVTLCALHASGQKEQASFDETYPRIPVEVTITNLTGTSGENLNIPDWFGDLFTNPDTAGFADLVKDVQLKCHYPIDAINRQETSRQLVGITSPAIVPSLSTDAGGQVHWYEGYDESIFTSQETFCLIPASMEQQILDAWQARIAQELEAGELITSTEEVELVMIFSRTIPGGDKNKPNIKQYASRFRVAGTYRGGDGQAIYCPYAATDTIYRSLGASRTIDSVQAKLADNYRLSQLKARRTDWFATPVPSGEKTPWGQHGYTHYPFALDINDDLLQRTTAAMENSIRVNGLCTLLVFVLSAGAGFFVGFLLIRGRQRTITLMRTMGTGDLSIYISFAVEQMLCALAGTLAGGSLFVWQPSHGLIAFVAVYFLGLTLALLLFLRKNLLTTIKEDE